MNTPLSYKLLLWYYNRFLKFDIRDMTAEQVRMVIDQKTGRTKRLLNGGIIPVHKVEDRHIPGRVGTIPVRIYHPHDGGGLPVITYFHGGGFVIYGLDSHDHVCRRICRDNKAIVVSVDYRLAPEHKFPAAVHDAYDGLLWVAENAKSLRGHPDRLIVMGDSAGGNLAAVASLKARDLKGPALSAQLLVYPAVDARLRHPSIRENGDGYILTEEFIRWFSKHYKNSEEDILHPYMSPLLADNHSNLPPTLVQVASLDPLRDEGIEYAEKLKAAGNKVQLTNYQGLTHSFFAMPGLSRRCAAAYDEIAAFLRDTV